MGAGSHECGHDETAFAKLNLTGFSGIKEQANVRRHSYRYQRTLARQAEVTGVGLLTGATVRLRFRPAPPSTGVVFVRTDLRPARQIPARVQQVTATQRRTTLGQAPAQVALVEHVLAALAGLRIDNCWVELNAPEPPGVDGSARPFVDALQEGGIVLQPARRTIWCIDSPVSVARDSATLTLHPGPCDQLTITYLLDYGPHSPIGRQAHTERITPQNFANELAGCRTFILESEVLELRRQGLGMRTTTADLLVFGARGPVDNSLRYANEPARHKILDLVGDLSLLNHDVRGHLVAYRSGHQLNIELVQALTQRIGSAVCPSKVQWIAA
jgi:UDP-3-O-acyl N-acetylglucosamine deacetylase